MDTTVAYGLGISASQLTDDQLGDDSNAYNTRIPRDCRPRQSATLEMAPFTAAVNPPDGKWLYFVTTNLQTGETKFVETEDEFWQIRDEYKNNNENANCLRIKRQSQCLSPQLPQALGRTAFTGICGMLLRIETCPQNEP